MDLGPKKRRKEGFCQPRRHSRVDKATFAPYLSGNWLERRVVLTHIDQTLFGVMLENPRTRMLHVSPALRHAKEMLREKGLLTTADDLTNEGRIAQQIIRNAHPRRAAYRTITQLRYAIMTLVADTPAAVSAVENLTADGLIEADPTYDGAWRWRE